MIAVPHRWTGHKTPDGVVLVPPDSRGLGAIRYVERVRPIRRVVDLVRTAELPANLQLLSIGVPRRLVTCEGEHAAVVTATANVDGDPVRLTFGFVFLDDYFARLVGVAADPAVSDVIATTVEKLVVSDVHLRGYPRRRRYLYEPPPGWQGLGDVFDTTWYPLDYPARSARIRVCAAVPAHPGVMQVALRGLTGRDDFMKLLAAPADDVATASGLNGVEWHVHVPDQGEQALLHAVFLEDDKMLYALQLWRHPGGAHDYDIFQRVVASLQPVPRPDSPHAMPSPFAYLVD